MKLTWVRSTNGYHIEYRAEAESVGELMEIMDRVENYRKENLPKSTQKTRGGKLRAFEDAELLIDDVEKELKRYHSTVRFHPGDFKNEELEEFFEKYMRKLIEPVEPGNPPHGPRPPKSQATEGGSQKTKNMPTIVCLCGSTRFGEAFRQANLDETLAGKIVLSIGCDMKSDDEIFKNMSKEEFQNIKQKLDELHFRKIELADEVLILNVDGYIGESTGRELAYAYKLGKFVRYLKSPQEAATL